MKRSLRLGALMSLAAAGTLAFPAGMATAAPSPRSAAHYTCAGGEIPSGNYGSVTVTGACSVPAHAVVTISGDLSVERNASLDADSAPSTIKVGGNVSGAPGAVVGLGCTFAHGGCAGEGPEGGGGPFAGEQSDITIKGNVSLNHVYNAALDGITVHGNVTSSGGGAGMSPPGFVPFSVKDVTIGGNLKVTGLTSVWFGVIRSTIGGNVILANNYLLDPDGMEVVHDTIGNNLICQGNFPDPQFGDAVTDVPDPSYPFSTVGGNVVGQCGFVLAP